MLEIRDLVCGYGHVTALKGLTIDVREGQLVALVGANGAGKSTALRAISGLVPTRAGAIRFRGRDSRAPSPAPSWPRASPTARRDGASSRR